MYAEYEFVDTALFLNWCNKIIALQYCIFNYY